MSSLVPYPAVTEAAVIEYIKTLAPTSVEPLFSTPPPTQSAALATSSPIQEELEATTLPGEVKPEPKTYFTCPAPAPQMILSEDDNGVPINIVIDPPLSSCEVSYDFELTLSEYPANNNNNEQLELDYISSLLPGLGDRLGESVADYLTLHTEYGPDETSCKGYYIGRRRLLHRLRAESSDADMTRIISLTGKEYQVDRVHVCNPPTKGCHLIHGKMNATYVGTDEYGVKSTVSRLIKDEMMSSATAQSSLPKGTNERNNAYSLRYIGPGNNDTPQQAPATPSAIISMEDIAEYISDDITLTPIGIGIMAALSAAFIIMCYTAFSKRKDLKEEVLDEMYEIQDKKMMKKQKKRSKKRGRKNVPLAGEDDDSECDSGYDLESVAIDVNRDGENDSQEAVEISGTVSFGHDAAVQHMARNRDEKSSKFSLAEAVNTIPRMDVASLRRAGRDIRKRNSPNRLAFSRSAQLASEIAADIRMISGCADAQTSADAYITAFQLPNPEGRRGGACTAALLEVLYQGGKKTSSLSWVDLLNKMRQNLVDKGYDQIPQLTSSDVIDVNELVEIVPNSYGTKRAVLIGINYTGQEGELSGCHNDIKHVAQYLQKVHGFKKQDMTVLLDNGKCEAPTFANIMMTLERVARESQPGDTVWLHYSGHGGRLPDDSGDEEDGTDETIIPLDFKRRGQIRDDDLLRYFVKPMKKGVTVTCIMDCCHSGTVLDLPYQFIGDGEHSAMEANQVFFKDLNKIKDSFSTIGNTGAGPRTILEDLEATDNDPGRSRTSPRRNESYNIQTLPSVPEADLPPPVRDTPSHRSKWSRLVSPTAVSNFDHSDAVIRMENSQGEEQWEV